MNELRPELKRLFNWARKAELSQPEEAPPGFAARVTAPRRPGLPSLLQELQGAAWGLSWAALILIACGAFLLLNQRSPAPAEPDLSSALSFVANNLPQ